MVAMLGGLISAGIGLIGARAEPATFAGRVAPILEQNCTVCHGAEKQKAELRLDSRVFLASCSYSHLGGWLEGAFMSAINAVAGLVVSLNQGNVGALNAEARKLFTTLKPVVPMD